ncbi:conserved hypothetical protein [Ricinus communis]|uniref:Uncharacterized protein n=1 Tax=Ricinus communis TaxID=3988 RepID=B9THT5_RICCO|nr:conserved hypothetical protein [Ricinus communis]
MHATLLARNAGNACAIDDRDIQHATIRAFIKGTWTGWRLDPTQVRGRGRIVFRSAAVKCGPVGGAVFRIRPGREVHDFAAIGPKHAIP